MSDFWSPKNWTTVHQSGYVVCSKFVDSSHRIRSLSEFGPGFLSFSPSPSVLMGTRVGRVESLAKDDHLPSFRKGERIFKYAHRALPHALETMKDFWGQFPFQEVLDLLDPESVIWDITEWNSCEGSKRRVFQGNALKMMLSFDGILSFEIPGSTYALYKKVPSYLGFGDATKSEMQYMVGPFEEMQCLMREG